MSSGKMPMSLISIKDLKIKQQFIQLLLIKVFIVGIFLPLKVSNVALLALLFFWILTGLYRHAIGALGQKKVLIFFIAFYFLHILGLLYSEDLFGAYKELEKKVPLLVLPVIIASIDEKTLRSRRRAILTFYTRVTAAVCVFLLAYAVYRYATTNDVQVFYFKEFTNVIQVNPIYLAMYVLFAFLVYFYELSEGDRRTDWPKNALVYLATLVILMCISSKTALGAFLLFSLQIILTQTKYMSWAYRVMVASFTVICIVVVLKYFPVTQHRIQDVMKSDWSEVWKTDYAKNATSFTGFTLRVSFWRITLEEMADDNLLLQGVGTGDGQAYLNRAYEEHGLIAAGYKDFNLHNAFMEVVLEFGLIGLIFYLIMWLAIAIFASRNRDRTLFMLVIIFLLFSMTESILYVNKGLAFFSFWVPLLLNYIYLEKTSSRDVIA